MAAPAGASDPRSALTDITNCGGTPAGARKAGARTPAGVTSPKVETYFDLIASPEATVPNHVEAPQAPRGMALDFGDHPASGASGARVGTNALAVAQAQAPRQGMPLPAPVHLGTRAPMQILDEDDDISRMSSLSAVSSEPPAVPHHPQQLLQLPAAHTRPGTAATDRSGGSGAPGRCVRSASAFGPVRYRPMQQQQQQQGHVTTPAAAKPPAATAAFHAAPLSTPGLVGAAVPVVVAESTAPPAHGGAMPARAAAAPTRHHQATQCSFESDQDVRHREEVALLKQRLVELECQLTAQREATARANDAARAAEDELRRTADSHRRLADAHAAATAEVEALQAAMDTVRQRAQVEASPESTGSTALRSISDDSTAAAAPPHMAVAVRAASTSPVSTATAPAPTSATATPSWLRDMRVARDPRGASHSAPSHIASHFSTATHDAFAPDTDAPRDPQASIHSSWLGHGAALPIAGRQTPPATDAARPPSRTASLSSMSSHSAASSATTFSAWQPHAARSTYLTSVVAPSVTSRVDNAPYRLPPARPWNEAGAAGGVSMTSLILAGADAPPR